MLLLFQDDTWNVGELNGKQGLYRIDCVQEHELQSEAGASRTSKGDSVVIKTTLGYITH